MPRVPEETVQQIVQNTDIVQLIGEQVALRQRGRKYVGLCPFHQEKTPSFQVDADRRLFYCFGCQTGGDAISFLQKRDNLTFIEALEILAERAGIPLDIEQTSESDDAQLRLRQRLYDAHLAALEYYQQQLRTHPEAAKARAYLTRRELDPDTIDAFQLGYAPTDWRALAEYLQVNGFGLDVLEAAGLVVRNERGYYDRFRDRIMFPIFDARGRCIAFGGRQLENDPKSAKYLNSSQTALFDKGHMLYGIHLHKGYDRNPLVVYEGYMDLISTWQSGVRRGVASLGTALTTEQCRLLRRYTDSVILCYDSDSAGEAATRRGMLLLHQAGLQVKVATLPLGKDPDEFIRLQGEAAFRDQVLNVAQPLLRYCKNVLRSTFDIDSIEGKSSYAREFLAIIASVASPVEAEEYRRELAAELRLSEEALRREQQMLSRTSVRESSGFFGVPLIRNSRREGTLSENVERDSQQSIQAVSTDANSVPASSSSGSGTFVRVAPGRIKAEEIVLALACADIRLATRLTEELSPHVFKDPSCLALAERLWGTFRSRLRVFDTPSLEAEATAMLSKLSFLEESFQDGPDVAFQESLMYLHVESLKDELADLNTKVSQFQEIGDEDAVVQTMRRMQALQEELASLRSRS